ncbi:MAG: hypothetical protein ABL889_10130 [Terricaulis sp.]
MAMLDDNPILKERLMGLGAFGGIAVFGLAAVNVMISGGFDLGAERAPYNREQPSAYVRVVEAAQYVSGRAREVSWDEPVFIGNAEAATPEQLTGENDGAAPLSEASDGYLHQQIAALYERQQEPQTEDTYYEDEPAYDDGAEQASYADEYSPDAPEKVISASENASPW